MHTQYRANFVATFPKELTDIMMDLGKGGFEMAQKAIEKFLGKEEYGNRLKAEVNNVLSMIYFKHHKDKKTSKELILKFIELNPDFESYKAALEYIEKNNPPIEEGK